ncbi:MAG TPA: creatininase family protein [Halanaerobiales bacterium]|nr:creatininase family protein [Halanaerobiales bacterium]
MTKKYEVQYMTRPEIKEHIKNKGTAILPIGSTEQHGPHLPLGTDTMIAKEMALRLAKRIEAVVYPPIPIGYTWVWRDIPGNLYISIEHLKGMIKDIVRNLDRNNLKKLIIVNAHGANDSSIKYAIRELTDEIDLDIYYFTYPALDKIKDKIDSKLWHGMLHAEEIETSMILAIDEDLCDMDKAVSEYPADDISYNYHHSNLPMGALSESGVFGDATKASSKKGEVIFKITVDHMQEVIEKAEESKDFKK